MAGLGVALAALLGFAGLAVDVANGYVVREILQHAVDDGALTAQRWSTQVDDPGVNPSIALTQAVASALDTARRDIQAHGLSGGAVLDAAVAGSRLRITARASVRTWFLRPFGITTLAPSASSDVALWMPAATPGGPPGTAPVFPSAAGPAPAATLPEAQGNAGGAQAGDAAPGPGPSDGLSGGSDGPAVAGGNITEGP